MEGPRFGAVDGEDDRTMSNYVSEQGLYMERRTSSFSGFGGRALSDRQSGVKALSSASAFSASSEPALAALVRCLRSFMQELQLQQ